MTEARVGLLIGVEFLSLLLSAPLWGTLADSSGIHEAITKLAIIGNTAVLVAMLFHVVGCGDSFGHVGGGGAESGDSAAADTAVVDSASRFGVFAAMMACSGATLAPVLSFVDAAVLEMLGDDYRQYGRFRLFGSMGLAGGALAYQWLFAFGRTAAGAAPGIKAAVHMLLLAVVLNFLSFIALHWIDLRRALQPWGGFRGRQCGPGLDGAGDNRGDSSRPRWPPAGAAYNLRPMGPAAGRSAGGREDSIRGRTLATTGRQSEHLAGLRVPRRAGHPGNLYVVYTPPPFGCPWSLITWPFFIALAVAVALGVADSGFPAFVALLSMQLGASPGLTALAVACGALSEIPVMWCSASLLERLGSRGLVLAGLAACALKLFAYAAVGSLKSPSLLVRFG
jgi:MFS family permease